MDSLTSDLTEGPIFRKLWMFFMPILASSLFQQLYTTVDSIVVGQIEGKLGLAAIDAVSALIRLPVSFFAGISAGAAIMISQLFGAALYGPLQKAEKTAVAASLVGGILLSAAGILIAPSALRWMAVPDTIYAMSLAYVRIYLAGLGFSLVYNICAGILRAVGNTRIPFRILVIAGLVNVVLDLLLVGPLQEGVAGAALATIISQAVSALLGLRALLKADTVIRLDLRDLRPDRSSLQKILKLGLPTSLQNSLYPVANIIVQASVNALGADTVAAWGLIAKLDLIIWLCMASFGPAVSTFAAQNCGAGKMERACRGTRYMVIMGTLLIGALSLILYLYTEPLARLFIDAASWDIIPFTRTLMDTQAPWYFTFVFGSCLAGLIQGTGETVAPMILTLLGTCGLRIAWILFYLPAHPGMLTIAAVFPVSWIVTSLGYIIYYAWYRRHRLAV